MIDQEKKCSYVGFFFISCLFCFKINTKKQKKIKNTKGTQNDNDDNEDKARKRIVKMMHRKDIREKKQTTSKIKI